MFTKDDLSALTTADASPAVSIFLPTHVAGREIRQDPIRLKNLLGEAEERLLALGLRRPEAEEILAPGAALAGDEEFWRHQQHGLAVFLAPGTFHEYRVPVELPEEVIVGPQFHVRPLLPLLSGEGVFLLLTVSAARVRLFEGARFGLAEVDVKDAGLPQSVLDVSGETDYENTRHASPVARPRADVFPGGLPKTYNFGETPEELRKAELIEFLRRVATGIEAYLGSQHTPLVLAAHPEIQGNFRAVAARLENLLADGITENPDALDEADLHARAYALVEPLFLAPREQALARFNTLFGEASPRVTTRAEEIVKAARFSRVDTLLLSPDGHLWGRYDAAADKVEAHGSPKPGDVDLLDDAAVQTLLQGGQIHVLPKEQLRPGALMQAILRY